MTEHPGSGARVTLLLLALVVAPSLASAEAVVVARRAGAPSFRARPVQSVRGGGVELEVRVVGPGGRLATLPPDATVRWLRVVPRMSPRVPSGRTAGHRIYSNSTMFGPDHGRWLGYDRIEYEAEPLAASPAARIAGGRLVITAAGPSRHGGLGTIWIAAAATLPGGRVVRTPDETTVDAAGLRPEVMRVGFRDDDTFVGWLGTYFGVPYVFGSTGAQADRYAGVDCADAMVGALRAAGRRGVGYTSVSGLASIAQAVSGPLRLLPDGRLVDDAERDAALRWGADVRRGDLVAMNFTDDPDGALPRAWDHVAALVGDGGAGAAPDGLLDGADLVRHMATSGLAEEPLRNLGHIGLRLWRWRR
jgi:hypothetical protein